MAFVNVLAIIVDGAANPYMLQQLLEQARMILIGIVIAVLLIVFLIIRIIKGFKRRSCAKKDMLFSSAGSNELEDTMELPAIRDIIGEDVVFVVTQDITFVHTNERII